MYILICLYISIHSLHEQCLVYTISHTWFGGYKGKTDRRTSLKSLPSSDRVASNSDDNIVWSGWQRVGRRYSGSHVKERPS